MLKMRHLLTVHTVIMLIAFLLILTGKGKENVQASLSEYEKREIEMDCIIDDVVDLNTDLVKNIIIDEKLLSRAVEGYLREKRMKEAFYFPDIRELSDFKDMMEAEQRKLDDKKNVLLYSNLPEEYRTWQLGYTKNRLSVRTSPSTKSKRLGILQWNSPIKWIRISDSWGKVEYKGKTGYCSTKYISNKGVKSYTKDTVYEHQKSWMDYRTITDTSTPQWKIEQTDAYTGNYGIRMIDGRYLCAVGSHYSHDVGRYVDLILDNGTIIPCILGDQKDDRDTDDSNMYTMHDGSVVEFVVDLDEVPSKVKISGSFNSIPEWNSSIREIRIYYYNPYKEY